MKTSLIVSRMIDVGRVFHFTRAAASRNLRRRFAPARQEWHKEGVRPNLPSVLALGLALCACGPRVFEASAAKPIVTSPPPVVAEPAPVQPRVEITDDKIVITEKIQFDYDKARIRPESDDLLAEIATVINANPRIEKIRIEGHASAEGSHDHNVELSQRRAKAVLDHLVERGDVDPARLDAQGYGPDQPIADNETEAGREANRRVEFTILAQTYEQTTTTINPATGQRRVETEAKLDALEESP
jgi:outer membrane protein OmpA-like peptidoglycan-associated protein